MSLSRYIGEVLRKELRHDDAYEAAYRAWRAEKPFPLKGPPEPYAAASARLAQESARRGTTESPAAAMTASGDCDAEKAWAAIDALPEKQRAALLLVFGEGLSHREAAAVLGCPEVTVSWRIHQARRKLG